MDENLLLPIGRRTSDRRAEPYPHQIHVTAQPLPRREHSRGDALDRYLVDQHAIQVERHQQGLQGEVLHV